MTKKLTANSNAPATEAVIYCRSGTERGLASQERITRAYASIHRLNVKAVVTQIAGGSMTKGSLQEIARHVQNCGRKCPVLISDWLCLGRDGYHVQANIHAYIKSIGIEIIVTGRSDLLIRPSEQTCDKNRRQ